MIDERSGIIVMGRDVRVSTVAVAQGNLTVTHQRDAAGEPAGAVLARPRPRWCRARAIGVQEDGKKLALVKRGRVAAATGRRPQRTGHRPARHDRDPAGDQGRGRDPGRHRGDVMGRRLRDPAVNGPPAPPLSRR